MALAFHDAHPLTLIVRAWSGDKEAVLELVRIDRLFLQDSSTAAVIRTAALRSDQPFMRQLALAQKDEPRLRRRDLIHIYLNVFFFLEFSGQKPPLIAELHRLLDPAGNIFPGLYAFERDFERRRKRFVEMFEEMDSQLPAIGAFYRTYAKPATKPAPPCHGQKSP